MLHRSLFILVTLFFVVMNFLLWRSEFGGGSELGSAVPADKVWQKVLTAPDNSSLEIRHRGVMVGICRWAPNVGEELATGKQMTEELPPEGMVQALSGYSVEADGNISLPELNRLNFHFSLNLDTNQLWQEVSLNLKLRPSAWEIRSRSAEKAVRLIADDEGRRTERLLRFDDLRNPEKLLRELGGSFVADTLIAMGLPLAAAGSPTETTPSWGLKWEARNEWLKIGRTRVRVYRLQARLLDRFQAVIFISPVGEILRVELPDEIVFTNTGLTN